MNDYLITCTSTCDLTKQLLQENNIKYVCFKMLLDGNTYEDDFFEHYPYEKFYDDMKNGKTPTTSQVGFGIYEEFFEDLLKSSKNIIHICLSGALSGDYSTAKVVADQLNEKYNCNICVIDSLAASSGYGMLVLLASDNLKNGMSFEDNVKYLQDNKLKIHHWFISTDLSSYIRGGRLSKSAGYIGTALKICPLMNVNEEGLPQIFEKIRTKSKAMEAQLNKMIELCDNGLDYAGKVFINSSMCEDDAQILKGMVLEKFKNVKDVPIYRVGTIIGTHTGQGSLALYFMGAKR